MADRIQLRRGTAAQWTSANPVLTAGEVGFVTDTGNIKIGDGTTAWNSLAYEFATLDGTETLTNKTISGATNTISNIGNSSLTNSAITINGTAVSLGGSITVSGGTESIHSFAVMG